MGADLYLEKIHHPRMEQYEPLFQAALRKRDSARPKSKEFRAAQREVGKYYDLMYAEGYFRDSYNVTNVLNRLGLSWWADVQPLCNNDRKLRGDNLRRFRDMVAGAELKLPSKEEIEKGGTTVSDRGANCLAAWHKYFVGKQAALLAFLNQAIETGSDIHCSL